VEAGLVDDRLVGVARSSIRQADGILLVVVEPGERVADVGNAEHRAYVGRDEPRLAADDDRPNRAAPVAIRHEVARPRSCRPDGAGAARAAAGVRHAALLPKPAMN